MSFLVWAALTVLLAAAAAATVWGPTGTGHAGFDADGDGFRWLRCDVCPGPLTRHEDHGDGRATCMDCGSVRHVAQGAGR